MLKICIVIILLFLSHLNSAFLAKGLNIRLGPFLSEETVDLSVGVDLRLTEHREEVGILQGPATGKGDIHLTRTE